MSDDTERAAERAAAWCAGRDAAANAMRRNHETAPYPADWTTMYCGWRQATSLHPPAADASALAAMLAEAERRGMERAAAICEARTARFGDDFGIEEGWIVDEALACAADIRAAGGEADDGWPGPR